jgi:hypothetical protein
MSTVSLQSSFLGITSPRRSGTSLRTLADDRTNDRRRRRNCCPASWSCPSWSCSSRRSFRQRPLSHPTTGWSGIKQRGACCTRRTEGRKASRTTRRRARECLPPRCSSPPAEAKPQATSFRAPRRGRRLGFHPKGERTAAGSTPLRNKDHKKECRVRGGDPVLPGEATRGALSGARARMASRGTADRTSRGTRVPAP